ncbi:MAG: S9 family peptidase [Parvularculaceae bacterium]|nr:S9 family peptidase [Parvularculaceae bacterium]
MSMALTLIGGASALALVAGAVVAAGARRPGNDRDPYLWLEEVEGENAIDWVKAQNRRSLEILEGDPRFDGLHRAALKIVNSTERIAEPSLVGDKVRNFWQDENAVRGLWREAELDDYLSGAPEWRTICDFDALAEAENENWVFQGADYLPPEYQTCMVTLSRGGSDAAVRREFDVARSQFVDRGFVLPESKGATAWLDADTLLVGIDFGDGALTSSGYPRTTRLLRRGGDLQSAPVVFEGEENDVGVWPHTVRRGGQTYAFITRAVTFFESEFYLLDDARQPQKLSLPLKSSIEGVYDGMIVATLQQDWRWRGASFKTGDVIALDPRRDRAELVFSPAPNQAVGAMVASEGALYLQLLDNVIGSAKKIVRDKKNWRVQDIDLPGNGEISLGSINPLGEDFFLFFDSPVTPATLHYIEADGERREVRRNPQFFNATGIIVEQRHATSKDGEKIPYFIIGRKDVIEAGDAPVIQYGYGGFEVPVTPGYSGVLGKLWLERGGVYVIANIRGGGEFGPRWHQAALKEKRQTGFDDFFAVSEALIKTGVTSPSRLGAYGGSNGGLLMGVALTQRPELYNALAIGVPLLDMLRFHKLLAGASWVGEYGDPENKKQRRVIEQYSPYQNLKKKTDYPCPFFFTSTKDDRVHPGHARKMAARMAEYGHDFLYYENIEGGHGAAANQNQAVYRAALQYVYFSRQLMDNRE